MAVFLFFGLPGCGKTTLLTKFACDFVMERKPRYQNVYSNVPLDILGVTYIDNDCIGKYELENAAILIDEATLYADSRDHANFTKNQITYFLEHRHFNVDIYLFTQQWDGVDRKIRVITDRVFYVYKPFLLGLFLTKYYRIPYGVIIPDPKKDQQKLGEIIQGYAKPNIFIRLFSPFVFRPKYYKYFDSWLRPKGFARLPSFYQPRTAVVHDVFCTSEKERVKVERRYRLNKTLILLRSSPALVYQLIRRSCTSLGSLFVKDKKSSY